MSTTLRKSKPLVRELPGDFVERPATNLPSIELAEAIERIETTERAARDRAREAELARLRELAKFD